MPDEKEVSNIARRRAAALGDARGDYLERRREIVAAASRVFKERGFRGTTLKHVAEALDIDRASLYYYVGSKDELFHEIVTEAANANLAAAAEIRDSSDPAPEKLRRIIEGLMVSYADTYPALYVLIQENLNHVAPKHSEWAAQMRQTNRDYMSVLIEVVQAGQDDGTLRTSAPAWLVAYGIMGMVGWTNRWFNPNETPLAADEIGAAFSDILLDGLVV
jgi:TetR/AcrR family transcriptional regulator, cholesterol catabolism regulator